MKLSELFENVPDIEIRSLMVDSRKKRPDSIFFCEKGMMFDGLAFMDALGVSLSTMSNAGPAFGQFGATCTYAALPDFSKIIVCLSMLFGRLESVTLLSIFIPSFWKRSGW